ncbi:hypothetical protein GOB10_11050 [Sinorhizobium meliloti]|uniref:hypothetical protein n=1 Tax=Rhizobium meliloti TaxID=382 RepID=UPI000FD9B36F|nr:hypothetical protein [Sinorhizobium meliloti]MDW9896309.1 hypothetical protein [Sinorhizobium meliloti]RVQ54219.1 hypothetical protein CN245_20040 [Sinorhizobium meliloti]
MTDFEKVKRREWFAGLAMMAIRSKYGSPIDDDHLHRLIVKEAYALADAMVAESDDPANEGEDGK